MLNALRRIIFALLVAVIVMTALTSVMLRLLTPMFSEYRTDVEQWASQLLQQPISIESIDAKMDGLTPKLNLIGVELLDLHRQFSIAKFDGLTIHFGVLSSLISGKVTFDHIELHGLDLSLVRDVRGNVSVSGLGGIKGKNNENKNKRAGESFGAWLLQQGKVSLYKSHISWLDMRQQRSLDFPEISLSIKNSGDHHIIHSMLELPEEIGRGLDIVLELNGNILDNSSWGGEVYLKGEGLKSHELIKGLALQDWKLQHGIIDGEFWGDIVSGKLEQIQGRFLAKETRVEFRGITLPIAHFNTQALLKKNDIGWQLQLSRINFGGALRGKMPRYLQLMRENSGWRLTLDQLDLSVLPPLIAVVEPELLGEAPKFGGHLREIDLYYEQGVESFVTNLDTIAVSGINQWPTVSGLDGHVDLSAGIVTLAINSPGLELNIPSIFQKKLPRLAVNGELSASWGNKQWQLWSHQISLNNNELNLNVAMNLQSQRKQSPLVSIASDINVAKMERLKHYVPDNLLSDGASGWLKEAFHSGSIKDGKLLIYGQGNNIVKRSEGGRMEISLNPQAVNLQFHKKWPRIDNIDADLRFSGRKMTIHSNQGEVLSSGRVDDVVVKVEDFKAPLLEVDGNAHFSAMDGIKYISLSPLEDILGDVDELIIAKGGVGLKLHLGIPLKEAGKNVAVGGELDFKKASLNIDEAVKVSEIDGTLSFNQRGVKRSTLNANIFKKPTEIAIYKKQNGSQKSTFIATRSQFDSQQILADINMPWARMISGKTHWNAMVEFNHTQKTGLLKIGSNLKGVKSRLPHPLNKISNEKLKLNLKYRFTGGSRKQIDMTLGKKLSAQMTFSKKSRSLSDLHIHLGGERLKTSKHSGLLFTGKLSQLNIYRWLEIISDSDSKNARKSFDLPIHIDMKRLHLLNGSGSDGKLDQKLDPSLWPPINMNINAIKYGSLQLGGVLLVTRPSKKGLRIKKLVVSDGNYKMIANGTWRNSSGTKLDLKLSAKDAGKMLKSLRLDTPLDQGNLTAKGSLRWPDSPIDFNLEKVKGDFNIQASDGVIEDVGTDAGQLLGLLNVSKFLNRIILDFSDLKEKSLVYKRLIGNFRIDHGNLYTNDFYLESAQTNMLLTGRTGLSKQDYDHELLIIPQISDAVPVLGTLIFGPQVAVALLAFRKLFGEEFDKASMQQYRITGSWDKPNIKKIIKKVPEGVDE